MAICSIVSIPDHSLVQQNVIHCAANRVLGVGILRGYLWWLLDWPFTLHGGSDNATKPLVAQPSLDHSLSDVRVPDFYNYIIASHADFAVPKLPCPNSRTSVFPSIRIG